MSDFDRIPAAPAKPPELTLLVPALGGPGHERNSLANQLDEQHVERAATVEHGVPTDGSAAQRDAGADLSRNLEHSAGGIDARVTELVNDIRSLSEAARRERNMAPDTDGPLGAIRGYCNGVVRAIGAFFIAVLGHSEPNLTQQTARLTEVTYKIGLDTAELRALQQTRQTYAELELRIASLEGRTTRAQQNAISNSADDLQIHRHTRDLFESLLHSREPLQPANQETMPWREPIVSNNPDTPPWRKAISHRGGNLLPMHEIDRLLRESAVRRDMISLECRTSWLIPVRPGESAAIGSPLYLTGFLYPVSGLDGEPKRVGRPRFLWTVDPATGRVVEVVDCQYRDFARGVEGEGEIGVLTANLLPVATVSELELFRTQTLDAYNDVLKIVFAPPANFRYHEREAVVNLRQLLKRGIEPFLQPFYRALNPVFFDWLEQF